MHPAAGAPWSPGPGWRPDRVEPAGGRLRPHHPSAPSPGGRGRGRPGPGPPGGRGRLPRGPPAGGTPRTAGCHPDSHRRRPAAGPQRSRPPARNLPAALGPGAVHRRLAGLSDPAADRFRFLAAAGPGAQPLQQLPLALSGGPAGSSLAARAWRSGRLQLDNDLWQAREMGAWQVFLHRWEWRAGAAVPVRRGGRPWGVVSLIANRPGIFDADLLALVARVGHTSCPRRAGPAHPPGAGAGPAGLAGTPRSPDRPAQPHRAQRAPGIGAGSGPAAWPPGSGRPARPGRLQAGQGRLRPYRRRPPAAGGRRQAAGRHAADGLCRPPGRG
ncbi:protein of unknown function [Candidatus Hydrogenisulfobacillus filiaventi]|uniref:GAF domain-containing protein n=1 Tax=Candidatus Hydrogenisulfobacillus filiaventi TaxID=2707344 RepID=A0A6F8ZFY8_9FIRM|nr:protein of unknown function [Candidatus Hydrogenisulfobacillus filiaventi]